MNNRNDSFLFSPLKVRKCSKKKKIKVERRMLYKRSFLLQKFIDPETEDTFLRFFYSYYTLKFIHFCYFCCFFYFLIMGASEFIDYFILGNDIDNNNNYISDMSVKVFVVCNRMCISFVCAVLIVIHYFKCNPKVYDTGFFIVICTSLFLSFLKDVIKLNMFPYHYFAAFIITSHWLILNHALFYIEILVVLFIYLCYCAIFLKNRNDFYLIMLLLFFQATICNLIGLFVEIHIRENFVMDSKLENIKIHISLELNKEKQLLRNIIPKFLVNEYLAMNESSKSLVKYYENLVVCHFDIVNFCKFSSELNNTKKLIKLINSYFSEFDMICKKYKLVKIKCIGDGYLICQLHYKPKRVVIGSFEIINAFKSINEKKNLKLFIRVGIAIGKAFLIVFGSKLIQIDIIGEAKRLAERLEESSMKNCIKVQERIKNDLDRVFEFKHDNNNNVDGYIIISQKKSIKLKLNRVNSVKLMIQNDVSDDYNCNNEIIENENNNKNGVDEINDKNRGNILKKLVAFERKYDLLNFKYLLVGDYKKYVSNVQQEYFANRSLAFLEFMFFMFIYSYFLLYLGIGLEFCPYFLHFILLDFLAILCLIIFLFSKKFIVYFVLSYALLLSSIYFLLSIYFIDKSKHHHEKFKLGEVVHRIYLLLPIIEIVCIPVDSIIRYFIIFFYFVMLLLLKEKYSFNISNVLVNFMSLSFFIFLSNTHHRIISKVRLECKDLLKKKIRFLKKEIKVNEKLLKSSLPIPYIKRMLRNKRVNYKFIKEGCILFLSIENIFNITPFKKKEFERSIYFLTKVFSKFDEIIINENEKDGSVKIKSIENKYLSVNGMNKDNEIETADKYLTIWKRVLDMFHFFHQIREKEFKSSKLSLLAGLTEGNYSSGIIGKKRFFYDVYGKAINYSCRLMTSCRKDMIHISQSFYDKLRNYGNEKEDYDLIKFQKRGKVYLKGIGVVSSIHYKPN